jgi:hypothetical protein
MLIFFRALFQAQPPITPEPPHVSTFAASTILYTSAYAHGEVVFDGHSAIVRRGFCWSTAANPTTADPSTCVRPDAGLFRAQILGLAPGATYHVRAFAENALGLSYGEDVEFTTLVALVPAGEEYVRRGGVAHSEWYECARCGFSYSRDKMIVQNGAQLCTGDGTCNCRDKPGAAALRAGLITPYEEAPLPLPNIEEEL